MRLRERRAEDGLPVPLQLQVLEADHLDSWKTGELARRRLHPAGHRVRRLGRRRAYWLYPTHPGDGRGALVSHRVPADRVLHLFERLRPGQVRGVPWFAPVMLKLRDLDAYDEAELVRKKIEACFAAFVTGVQDEETLGKARTEADGSPHRDLRARDDRVPRARARREVRLALGLGRLRRVHAAAAPCHRRRRRAHLRAADRRPQPGELLLDPGRADRVPPPDGGAAVAAARPRPLPAGLAALRAGGAGRGQAARRRHRRRLDRAALRGGRSDEGHPGRHPRGARRGDDAEGGDRPPGLRAGAGAGRDRRDQRRARCPRHHARHRPPPVDPHRPGEAASGEAGCRRDRAA